MFEEGWWRSVIKLSENNLKEMVGGGRYFWKGEGDVEGITVTVPSIKILIIHYPQGKLTNFQ